MTIKTIFLVQGNTGSYEDKTTWVVAAHETEALANEHARLADIAAKELIQNNPVDYYLSEPTRFDLGFKCLDRYVTYSVTPVPLILGTLPAAGLYGLSTQALLNKPPPEASVPGSFSNKLSLALNSRTVAA